MIYKEYFINSEFEDVWCTLQTCYNEPESVRNLYKTLFYTIRNLPIDNTRSEKPMQIVRDFEGIEGIYVNIHNASRYIGRIFSQYDFDKIGKDKDDNLKVLRLSVLRRAKAYKILWKFLDHNLTYWWD